MASRPATGFDQAVSQAQDAALDAQSMKISALPSGSAAIDLRSLDYITDYDPHLACPICRCPFIDPINLTCSHSYCRQCYYKALDAQGTELNSCPTCRRLITSEPVAIPRFLRHLIEDLLVKCPNTGLGCDMEVRRGEVQDHVDHHCQWTLIDCPDEACDQLLPRRLQTLRCLHTKQACDQCHEPVAELDLSDHEFGLCEAASFTCEDCSRCLPVIHRKSHSESCPLAQVSCKAVALGCPAKTTREAMPEHVSYCMLAKLAPTVESLERRMDGQDKHISSLQTRNELLEGQIDNLQLLLDRSNIASASVNTLVPSGSGELSSSPLPGADMVRPEDAPFASAAEHMLSLHESLREELDRVSAAISQVDGKASMTIINETLRIRDDMSRQNAAISSLGMQVQWLVQQRLQGPVRGSMGSLNSQNPSASGDHPAPMPGQPIRRLSETRQDVKL